MIQKDITRKTATRQSQRIERRQPRPKVVIEHYSDGYTKVYSDCSLDIQHVDRPHVTTSTAGIQADRVIDLSLPRRFEGIFEPGNVQSLYMPTKTEPIDLIEREEQLILWNGLTEMGRTLRDDTGR